MQGNIIRLRKGRLGKVKPNHPWIYKSQFLKVPPSIKPSDAVSVVDSENRFIGRGYYNPKSKISIRILTFKDEAVDENFFSERIRRSAAKRTGLLARTNAYRAVFSEADDLPGLIVDVYANTVVFQILTLGLEALKPLLVKTIKEVLNPAYIYEKSASAFRTLEGLKDIRQWWGAKGKAIIQIFEGKAKFLVDIENGHKTGFYLDQRRSRMALEGISKDKKVLDLFCYTGGFSINAAIFGAASVLGVDIKKEWLELGRKNAGLNSLSDRIEFVNGDAFSILRNIYESGQRFDIIIIDPPSFVKSRRALKSASKGYKELNLIAMKVLNEGGILATFSCSHNMPNELFSTILKEASHDAGKSFSILRRCRQAEDHPIARAIPETEYLKGYFLKVHSANEVPYGKKDL